MVMEKQLSVLVIGSTPYIIDAHAQCLRQYNDMDMVISFSQLAKGEGYYTGSFQRTGKWIRPGDPAKEPLLEVILPDRLLQDAGQLTNPDKADLNTLSHHKGWGFYIGDEETALRFSGKLPHIELAGSDFTVDWRLKELREMNEPWNRIQLDGLEMSDSGEHYLCFYNTDAHKTTNDISEILARPEKVVLLEIPYEVELDPVAVAREYGIGDIELLPEHPVKMYQKAKVTALSAEMTSRITLLHYPSANRAEGWERPDRNER
jgi:hypothetical protein